MARTGRPSKGPRHPYKVSFPLDHAAVYQELADRAGLAVSDYVVQCMADAHGLDVPEWAQDRRSDDQEALPLAS